MYQCQFQSPAKPIGQAFGFPTPFRNARERNGWNLRKSRINYHVAPANHSLDHETLHSFRLVYRGKREFPSPFRGEAYNLFNNVDFANPSVTLSGAKVAFGRISSVVNNPPHRPVGPASRIFWVAPA